MRPRPTTCPKCSGPFDQGVTSQFAVGLPLVLYWMEGEPKQTWSGVTLPPRETWIPLATLRCSACGYVESYARPEFEVK